MNKNFVYNILQFWVGLSFIVGLSSVAKVLRRHINILHKVPRVLPAPFIWYLHENFLSAMSELNLSKGGNHKLAKQGSLYMPA